MAVAARPAPVDEGNALRKMRQRHEERNLGSFRLVYPAAPNAPDAELYCEIEAAAHRAQEEGEAKPVLEPSCAVEIERTGVRHGAAVQRTISLLTHLWRRCLLERPVFPTARTRSHEAVVVVSFPRAWSVRIE